METIELWHAGWFATLPHRVTPLQNEWLPGLLLRCDEANHWRSKKTLYFLLLPSRKQYPTDPPLFIVAPDILDLEALTRTLAVSVNDLLATTYQVELSRCYGIRDPQPWLLLRPSISFHLCPECLAHHRLLPRFLALPHITTCPSHRLVLVDTCLCGTPLQLFHPQGLPFTCYRCGLDWSRLPRVKPPPQQMAQEQNYLTWYAFFFSSGSPKVLQYAFALLDEKRSLPSAFGFFPQKTWQERLEHAEHVLQRPMALAALILNLVRLHLLPDDIVLRLQ